MPYKVGGAYGPGCSGISHRKLCLLVCVRLLLKRREVEHRRLLRWSVSCALRNGRFGKFKVLGGFILMAS
jgi:hypothetical protein